MAATRVVMNQAGYDAYRNSPSVVALLESAAERIRAAAQANVDSAFVRPWGHESTPDITVDTVHDTSRAVVFVATGNEKARMAEHLTRALNRAVVG